MIDFKYPEGATPIDPDEAEGLLLTHITTHGELNRWEQDNIVEAMAWIDKIKPTNILNEQFIKQLHKRMFGNIWRWAGQFRLSDKNLGALIRVANPGRFSGLVCIALSGQRS